MIVFTNATTWLAFLMLFLGCKHDVATQQSSEESVVFATSPFLMSVEEVATLLDGERPPQVIEVSKAARFSEGHLSGAANVWRPDYGDKDRYPYGGMRASRQKMAELLSRLGTADDELIIVYCTKGSADATRLHWILRGYGHDRVVVMDGGKAAWKHAGYQLEQEQPTGRNPTNYRFYSQERENYFVALEEVVAAIGDTNTIILDVREDYEHLGTPHVSNDLVVRFKDGGFAPGAIPGARHLNWSEAVDLHSDHTFKSLADLNHNFLRQGVKPDKKILVYCQSGVRSAHTTFVLKELLGYPDVRNYDGSWIEWSYTHAKDTLGLLQWHTNPDETEIIYRDLMDRLENEEIE